jgi:parallel beta-helix repeat protein
MRQTAKPWSHCCPAAPRTRPTGTLGLHPLEDRTVPAVIWVDDDGRDKKNADFSSIQAAVAAAHPGDTVMVAPGTYREHVSVETDGLTLRSQKPLAARIVAPAVPDPTYSVVRLAAAGVTLDGFTVTGGASPAVDIGVLVDAGASAVVSRNLITDIRQPAGDPYEGNGWGVWVGGLAAGGATAEVTDNTITGYRKTGIVAFDPDTFVRVTRNTVVGGGPGALVPQYGIELQAGASGEITHNTATDHVYAPAGTEAAGILVESAGRVVVSHNLLTRNELGVAAVRQTAPLEISHNTAVRNLLDGIYLEAVRGATVAQNTATDNGENGVRVTGQSSGNRIEKNDLRGNAAADAFDDTAGGGTGGTANLWLQNKCDDDNRDGLLCGHQGS